jgi:hypothetical protein
LISAVGIASFLFLNVEGRRIVEDAVSGSQNALRQLETSALTRYTATGAPAKISRIKSLQKALENEIRNPLNCGQGAVAQGIIAELQVLMPEFRPISGSKIDCSRNERVIAAYKESINQLTLDAPWNNSDLPVIADQARAERSKLQEISNLSGTGGPLALLRQVKPALQSANERYRDLKERLVRQNGDVGGLPDGLPTAPVEALGESSQIVSLALDRWDRPTTYIYLVVALFMDWLSVYIFAQLKASQPGRRNTLVQASPADKAW